MAGRLLEAALMGMGDLLGIVVRMFRGDVVVGRGEGRGGGGWAVWGGGDSVVGRLEGAGVLHVRERGAAVGAVALDHGGRYGEGAGHGAGPVSHHQARR